MAKSAHKKGANRLKQGKIDKNLPKSAVGGSADRVTGCKRLEIVLGTMIVRQAAAVQLTWKACMSCSMAGPRLMFFWHWLSVCFRAANSCEALASTCVSPACSFPGSLQWVLGVAAADSSQVGLD